MKTEYTKTVDPRSNEKNRFRAFAACLFSTKFRAGGVKLENLAAAAAAATALPSLSAEQKRKGDNFCLLMRNHNNRI